MFSWSRWKSWACAMQIWVDGSAETVWLWFDDLVDRFEVIAVHMEKRGCLPVFFFLICFQVFFFYILFIFWYETCRVQGRSYSEAFFLTPLAHLLGFEEQQVCFPQCWKCSVSQLRWSELNRGWYLCASSEETCGTLAGICVKHCKSSLLTDVYRPISSKWECFLGHVVIRPRIRLQYGNASAGRLFLPSRMPPALIAGVLDEIVLGPIHCMSGSYASLWGFPPRLDDR